MCKILLRLGYIDAFFKPSKLKTAEPLYPPECSLDAKSRDEKLSISISHQQQMENEESKSDITTNEKTMAYTEDESLNNATSSDYWAMIVYVNNSKPYC